jgi:hypothetical protein
MRKSQAVRIGKAAYQHLAFPVRRVVPDQAPGALLLHQIDHPIFGVVDQRAIGDIDPAIGRRHHCQRTANRLAAG